MIAAGGLHAGLAIKRQRKRRLEHNRARERRFSTRSNESGLSSFGSPRGSLDGGKPRKKRDKSAANFESNVGIGMLHIGVVFIVLGGFLLASGLMPDDFDKFEWEYFIKLSTWWNELVVTGAFSLLLGVFLIILNKFISGREEANLEEYVARQLTRSKSGHMLIRDLETGNLTTKRSKSSNLAPDDVRKSMVEEIPDVHHTVKSPPPIYDHHQPHVFVNGDSGLLSPQLEQILEEEASVSERGVGHTPDGFGSTTASLSTVSPSETQELLMDVPYAPVVPSKYHQVRMSKI